MGLQGFALCIVGSFILGVFLAIPVAVIFTYLILKKAKNKYQSIEEKTKQ